MAMEEDLAALSGNVSRDHSHVLISHHPP